MVTLYEIPKIAFTRSGVLKLRKSS